MKEIISQSDLVMQSPDSDACDGYVFISYKREEVKYARELGLFCWNLTLKCSGMKISNVDRFGMKYLMIP